MKIKKKYKENSKLNHLKILSFQILEKNFFIVTFVGEKSIKSHEKCMFDSRTREEGRLM